MEQVKVLFDGIVFLPVDEINVIISIDNELNMKTTDGSLQRFLLECKQINYVTDKPCEQLYKC